MMFLKNLGVGLVLAATLGFALSPLSAQTAVRLWATLSANLASGQGTPLTCTAAGAGCYLDVQVSGSPTLEGIALAASAYINWSTPLGTSGYGLRDNAGTIEFKDTGGSWAPISSSASGGGWQRIGTVVSLVTGTDTIGSNLRPTDATYTLGDSTHHWTNVFSRLFTYGASYLDLNAGSGGDIDFETTGSVFITAGGGASIYLDNIDDFVDVGNLFVEGYDWSQIFSSGISANPDTNFIARQVVTGASAITNAQNLNAEVLLAGTSTVTESISASLALTTDDTALLTNGFVSYSSFTASATSHIVTAVNYYAFATKAVGATIDVAQSFYAADLAGIALQPYYLWFDSRGVYRVREDNVADGSGNPQAVPALYNPRFTKYTPGLVNFERIIEQWVANVAVIGTESGGTGTLRNLKLIGAGLVFDAALVAPASSGTRFLCISTAGVITSSATACVGT